MEIACSIGGKFTKLAVDRVISQLKYLCCYTSTIKDFEEQLNNLRAERDAMQLRVTADLDNGRATYLMFPSG